MGRLMNCCTGSAHTIGALVNLKKYTKSNRSILRRSLYVIGFLYSQNHKTCCHPRKQMLEVEKAYPAYRENGSRMYCVSVMPLT